MAQLAPAVRNGGLARLEVFGFGRYEVFGDRVEITYYFF